MAVCVGRSTSNGRGSASNNTVAMGSCSIGHSCSTEIGGCRLALICCFDGRSDNVIGECNMFCGGIGGRVYIKLVDVLVRRFKLQSLYFK